MFNLWQTFKRTTGGPDKLDKSIAGLEPSRGRQGAPEATEAPPMPLVDPLGRREAVGQDEADEIARLQHLKNLMETATRP